MGLTAYIDPGKHFCGIACGDPDRLYWVSFWREASKTRLETPIGSYSTVDRVVVEMPNAAFSKVPPQGLLEIAARGHWVAGKCFGGAKLAQWYPNVWKGTVDGDAMTGRIIDRLSPEEKAKIKGLTCPEGLLHNVIDAVGMYLKDVGRL